MATDLQGPCSSALLGLALLRRVLRRMLTTQALTLLEYLIKHGSERVVDDARAHISTIKMLRNFHYTDEKGKDQGINGRLTAVTVTDSSS